MKYYLILILLFSLSSSYSQQESDKILQWNKVDTTPIFPGCEDATNVKICSEKAFIDYIKEEFSPSLLNDSISNFILNFKVIIGVNGKLKWSSVQSNNLIAKNEAENILKKLPLLTPGSNNGKVVNVMVDFGVNLQKENEIVPIESVDIPPMPKACEKYQNKKQCLAYWISNFVNSNFNTDVVKSKKRKYATYQSEVNFVINENGRVTKITATGNNELINQEAIRVVSTIPTMKPAIKNQKPISVNFNLPIKIGLSY